MFHIKGYCAGIIVFQSDVQKKHRIRFIKKIKSDLKKGILTITFGLNSQEASEICIDVYTKVGMKYRPDLSVVFKK